MPGWSSQDVEKLRELRAAGRALTAMAKELGKTRSAVGGMIARLKLPNPGTRPRQEPPKVRVRVRVRKKAPPPKPVMPALPVPFLKAESHHCRGILDQPGPDSLIMFCGATQIKGSSYCASHHALYHQPDRYQRS